MPRYDETVAETAMDMVAGTIIASTMLRGLAKRQDLHIVVGNSEGKVLASSSLGDLENWEHPYDKIAESKFALTVKHQMPTRQIQGQHPELSGEEGDTFFWGSYIDGGIVVACSGVQAYWDEAYSKCIVAVIKALVTAKQEDEMQKGGHFL